MKIPKITGSKLAKLLDSQAHDGTIYFLARSAKQFSHPVNDKFLKKFVNFEVEWLAAVRYCIIFVSLETLLAVEWSSAWKFLPVDISDFYWADVSIRSPRKLVVYFIKNTTYRMKVSEAFLFLTKQIRCSWYHWLWFSWWWISYVNPESIYLHFAIL